MVITQGQAQDLTALATIAKALSVEGISEQITDLHHKWVDLNALNAQISIDREEIRKREEAVVAAETLAIQNNARADEALNRANGLLAQAKSDAARAEQLRIDAEKFIADADAERVSRLEAIFQDEQNLLLRKTEVEAEFKRADALKAEYESKLSQLKNIAG